MSLWLLLFEFEELLYYLSTGLSLVLLCNVLTKKTPYWTDRAELRVEG